MFSLAVLPVTVLNFKWTSVTYVGTWAISGVSWLAFGRISFARPMRKGLIELPCADRPTITARIGMLAYEGFLF